MLPAGLDPASRADSPCIPAITRGAGESFAKVRDFADGVDHRRATGAVGIEDEGKNPELMVVEARAISRTTVLMALTSAELASACWPVGGWCLHARANSPTSGEGS